MKVYRETGKYSIAPYLSEVEYRKALLSFVKYCVDIILIDKDGYFLLPERNENKAASGPWFVGGQVPAFQTVEKQLLKIFKRETNLNLPFKRFTKVTQMRYWFSNKSKGKIPHDAFSEIFSVTLNEEEIKKIHLDNDEYKKKSIRRYNINEIKKIKNKQARNVFLDLWKLTCK